MQVYRFGHLGRRFELGGGGDEGMGLTVINPFYLLYFELYDVDWLDVGVIWNSAGGEKL